MINRIIRSGADGDDDDVLNWKGKGKEKKKTLPQGPVWGGEGGGLGYQK